MDDLAPLLDHRLNDYGHVPEVAALIHSALGLTNGPICGQTAISAFHLVPGDSMFAAYLLSEGALHICETNETGAVLIVTIPFNNIRRVTELHNDDTLRVSIEVDADIARTVADFETLSGPGDNPTKRTGIGRIAMTTTYATYELSAVAEDPAQDDLHQFARTIRRRLSHW